MNDVGERGRTNTWHERVDMLGGTLAQEPAEQRDEAMQAAAAVLWDYQTAWSEGRQRTMAAWL
eukprot:11723955-Prorocentrum_lima.AAC.1